MKRPPLYPCVIVLFSSLVALLVTYCSIREKYPTKQYIGVSGIEETSPSDKEKANTKADVDYWSEVIPSPDGKCHCPGNMMCAPCPGDDSKQCACGKPEKCICQPTRLDYYEAQKRYESVRRSFAPVIQSLDQNPFN